MCKMMQFSPFQKPFPKAPCCLLVDAVALETLSSLCLPSLVWKLWPSASWGLEGEGVDICFLYQSFVLLVLTLCGAEMPLEGREQAKQIPPPCGEILGCESN